MSWSNNLICYFDATIDKELAVVSGYASTAARWELFDIDWRLLLAKEDLPYFHMREFTVSRGPFEKWKDNEPRRRRFIGNLADIIKSHAIRGFATLVPVKNYWAVNERFQLTERAGNPYSFCARGCAEKVKNWAWSIGRSEDGLVYIFEDGDQGKGLLVNLFKRDGFPEPMFKRKFQPFGTQEDILTPFQAADLIAWEQQKSTKQVMKNSFKTLRMSFRALQAMETDWGIFGLEQSLVNFCVANEIPAR